MKSDNQSIPLSVPVIQGNEWKYIKECLDTEWVSSVGSYVDRFEKVVADYIGAKYAVATVNGTAALHLSLLASGVEPGDEVIVPTVTFIAPANVARYCGAYPVFMDCNIGTLCIDVRKVTDFINNECIRRKDGFTYNKKTERRIGAIIPVHVFGHPVDMDPLLALSKRYNIPIIEDSTESLGSEYKGKKTGSLGEIGCFSFNGNKIVTTGGGGMVVTNDKQIADRIRHLSTQAKKDSIGYDHDDIGYNYRLTNIQAAMGVAQMEKLEEFMVVKRKNAALYRDYLADIDGVGFIWEEPWAKSNFWFYTIRMPKRERGPLIEYLLSQNIEVRPIWRLIHTLPMYRDSESYLIKKAEEAYDTSVNLPCSVNLKEDQIRRVVDNVRAYFNGAKAYFMKNKVKI